MSETDEKLAAIRKAVPVTERVAFLNAGSHGPLTVAAARSIQRATEEELNEGRLGALQFQRTAELKTATRAEFARLLNCATEEVALTTCTTAGVNIACLGLDWRPGDEVITTTAEHMGGLGILYVLESRFGVRLRFAEIGTAGEALLPSITAALNERTRLIVLSHVSWSAGIVLPLQEIAAVAHDAGALIFGQNCDERKKQFS